MDYDPTERPSEKNEEYSLNPTPNIPENIPNLPINEETNPHTDILIPKINEEKKEIPNDVKQNPFEDEQLFNKNDINFPENIGFDDQKTEIKNLNEPINEEVKQNIIEEHEESPKCQQSPIKSDNNSPTLNANPISEQEESKEQKHDINDLVHQIIYHLIHKIPTEIQENPMDQTENLPLTSEITNPNAVPPETSENGLMEIYEDSPRITSEIQNPHNLNDLPENPHLLSCIPQNDFEEEDKNEENKSPTVSKENPPKKHLHRSLSLPDLTSISEIEDLPRSISVQDFCQLDSNEQIDDPKNKNNRNSGNYDEENKGETNENHHNNQPRFVYGHALEDIVYNVNNLRGQLNLLKRVTENAGIDATYLQNIDQSFSMALNGIQQTVNERLLNNNPNSNLPEMSEAMLIQMLKELQSNREEEEAKTENERQGGSRWENSTLYKYWRNFRTFMEFLYVNTKSLGSKVCTLMKNPENLFKVLVFMIAVVFYSGLRQIPKLEKYDGELFDWLAYNKGSRMLLFVKYFFFFFFLNFKFLIIFFFFFFIKNLKIL